VGESGPVFIFFVGFLFPLPCGRPLFFVGFVVAATAAAAAAFDFFHQYFLLFDKNIDVILV